MKPRTERRCLRRRATQPYIDHVACSHQREMMILGGILIGVLVVAWVMGW